MIRWMSVLVSMIWVRERYFVKLDNIGVTQDLENADLAGNAFDVRLLHYLLFLQSLHCHTHP